MEHFNVTFQPQGISISLHKGATLLEAAGKAGIILNTVCGGNGTCEKCAVIILPEGKRVLACQYDIDSDINIKVPPESEFFEQNILSHGIEAGTRFEPDIYKNYCNIAAENNIFGIAVDIGTTTVVAKLINMTDGSCLATKAALNPQSQFGDDVIARISYARNEENLAELQSVIINRINELILALCQQASITAEQIYEMNIVGNTTMNHIFRKLPLTSLGQAPYHAYCVDAADLKPEQLGLKINPAANVHTVENIAGFVGADTVAAAIAADIDSAEKMTLLIDIGTNGEIVLGKANQLYAASCAAGPALEGARIYQGSSALEGAIQAVVINDDDIDIDVIGAVPARTICGSGLIDAVAVLLELGIIEKTGKFTDKTALPKSLPAKIKARLTQKFDQPAFYLDKDKKVMLTQKDIRETQLAKAAIRTGIKLLQKKTGIDDSQIEICLLAGAFGNYIKKQSALKTGLLPAIEPEKIHFIGNAAATGAVMTLLSSRARAQAGKSALKIKYIELAREKDFNSIFTDSLLF